MESPLKPKRSRWGCVFRLAGLLLALGPALLLFSVLQVLSVRWLDPPLTPTMVQRMWAQPPGARRWVHRGGHVDPHGAVARAFVASEDGPFYLHHGFDHHAICLAIQGGGARGGSTISQQVAKNVFLVQSRSYLRKGLEAWYTLWLELLLPKDRILALYLQVAETGPLTFGAEAGAQLHFHTSADQLTPWEAGLMAGLLPDPQHRTVRGKHAVTQAKFVAKYPAPFPGDPGFSQALQAYENPVSALWDCL